MGEHPGDASAGGVSRFIETADGRRLHVVAAGAGEPTVVFESGAGGSRSCWAAAQARVAERTSTVAYDRAGLGRSDPDSQPRTLDRLVDDLLAVLADLGDGSLVLVGHSWGGPIVRVAAAARPDRVRGLVLVDPTDETCDLYFNGSFRRQQRIGATLIPWAGRLRIAPLFMRPLVRHLPPGAGAELAAEGATTVALRTMVVEQATIDADLLALRRHAPSIEHLPVTVISGQRMGRFAKSMRQQLVDAHQATAERLPRGRHVWAPRSGHMVPFTDPDVVANEVLRLIDDLAG